MKSIRNIFALLLVISNCSIIASGRGKKAAASTSVDRMSLAALDAAIKEVANTSPVAAEQSYSPGQLRIQTKAWVASAKALLPVMLSRATENQGSIIKEPLPVKPGCTLEETSRWLFDRVVSHIKTDSDLAKQAKRNGIFSLRTNYEGTYFFVTGISLIEYKKERIEYSSSSHLHVNVVPKASALKK